VRSVDPIQQIKSEGWEWSSLAVILKQEAVGRLHVLQFELAVTILSSRKLLVERTVYSCMTSEVKALMHCTVFRYYITYGSVLATVTYFVVLHNKLFHMCKSKDNNSII
jgi:hypothetical protein